MKFQEVQVKSRRTNENQRKAKTSHWKFTDIIDNQRVDRMFMNIFENPKNSLKVILDDFDLNVQSFDRNI